ncbi:hypothetical protein MRX96_019961 [Rhipicephalus microplus]
MEESCCDTSSDTLEKMIDEMESGVSSEAIETDSTPVPGTPTEQMPPPAPTTQSTQSPATSMAARAARKRRRPLSAARESQEAMLAEQKMLREQLERAQQTEVELRSKHLQLQEKLVNALIGFINKT